MVDAHEQLAAKQILIVDDEVYIREVLRRYLEAEQYGVLEAADGNEALQLLAKTYPDLIILDLMLPGVNGIDICRRVRAKSAVPILMVTARSDESDIIEGLSIGADDYVVKPFSPREVVVRVQAILRRVELARGPALAFEGALRFGELVIMPEQRRVEHHQRPVEMSSKEFDLLYFLARHPHIVFSRQLLLDRVWGFDFSGDASTVTVCMHRLRERIEDDPANAHYLKTVWGVGYKFEP